MSKRDYWLYISDIKDSIVKIGEYTCGKTFDDLCNNSMLMDAIIRNFTIIGEASRNVPKEWRQKYNQIEWNKLSDLRNIIVHEYFGVKKKVIWELIQEKIPDLLEKIELILQDRP